tara:strand:- start:105 stop:1028 length:924 start_codon:yes stop_codon:yes gene_type:complete
MNYSNPHLKNDQEDVIKKLLLELEQSGRISRDSEDLAMQKLGIMNSDELWRLLEQKRKENIIGEEQKINRPNWNQNINTPPVNTPGKGRSGYVNSEESSSEIKYYDNANTNQLPPNDIKSSPVTYESPPFMMGTPFWKLGSKLPEGAYDWALSLQTNMEKVDEKLSSTRGGFQSVATDDFNQLPPHIRDHIQSNFKIFPIFKFTSWWVNINNKGNYNISHTHGGDSDLAVIWYLTDNQSSLVFHNPFSCARHNLNLAMPETYQQDVVMNANAGDFVIFPADVPHSVEQHKLDTPRVSLSLKISFELE